MSVWITRATSDKERLISEALLRWNPRMDPRDITFLPGGSNSVAVRAGDFVCRFPQTNEVFSTMRRESEITEILNGKLSAESRFKIAPVFIFERKNENVSGFSYHRHIKGKIMDNIRGETEFNTCYSAMNDKQREILAREIGFFLADLHSISVKNFQNMSVLKPAQNWDFTRKINKNQGRGSLLQHSDGRIDLNDFKAKGSDDIVFCHNDLSGSNLLIDPSDKSVLTGIIDFANADFRARTDEFIPLYKVGRDLVRRVIGYYNRFSKRPVNMREIDYKFLCFVCFLLEQQKKPSFFVTALIEDFVQSYFNIHT